MNAASYLREHSSGQPETVAFVALGMLLFAKVFPLIPLFDIKEGMVFRHVVKVGRKTIPASIREGLPHRYYEKNQ